MPEIKIKYFNKDMPEVEFIANKSDWIDLRAAETKEYKAGDFFLMPLGVAMQLPEGFEAHVVPRSSTFKNYGIIQTNGQGIIDESYNGPNDMWFMPCLAMRDGTINKNDRICQFRIVPKMPYLYIESVDELDNADRGGHGSTGVK